MLIFSNEAVAAIHRARMEERSSGERPRRRARRRVVRPVTAERRSVLIAR